MDQLSPATPVTPQSGTRSDAQLRVELEGDGWRWVEAGQAGAGTPGDELFLLAEGASVARGRRSAQ